MAATSFPLVRGRTMRVTGLDGCCTPAYGPDNSVVTEGFVSVALTATVNTPDEIVVTNANGKTCVRDTGCPEFQGYGVELTFCDVTPCLFSLITGQPVVLNADGDAIGFRMNSGISACDRGFALEVWMGVPGVACSGAAGAFGYLLLPCLQGGVIGDFTIENAAVTFTITGATTKDGNGWGTGPYNDVMGDATGNPGPLPDPLDPDDHLYVAFTTVAPPEPTEGCVELTPTTPFATGATEVAGAAGNWTPSGNQPPANVPNLIAGTPNTFVASPTTAWGAGSYVQTATSGAAGQAYWNGTAWVAGVAP
ncbi:MAG: hypothetical protein EHM24_00065 [Acidobacteria bacterium]|nr:MAG: hypothetical protein EHM24_00065 [Acidobacteriota bacterium]